LPATSAANPVGPAAASACASVGKFSIRQNNGPAGRWLIFFSATGLISNFCANAADGDNKSPSTATAQQQSPIHLRRLDSVGWPFMAMSFSVFPFRA
jgi:hypothetical protein